MYCLFRYFEEVDDVVFYDESRSLVFLEVENRFWVVVGKLFLNIVICFL